MNADFRLIYLRHGETDLNRQHLMQVDLAGTQGENDLWLDFWAKVIRPGSDTGRSQTYVELSADGLSWHTMLSRDVPGSYTHYTVDLDQAIAAAGIDLTSDSSVYLRFRHETTDSYWARLSALYLDDVRVGLVERVGPRVLSHSPVALASDAGPLNAITLTFNEAMDPAEFDGSDVELKHPGGVSSQ